MELTTILKSSGRQMPLFGLGTFPGFFGQTDGGRNSVGEAVEAALRLGCRHFDCAFAYGNEAEVGQALKRGMQALDISRYFQLDKFHTIFTREQRRAAESTRDFVDVLEA